MPQILKSEALPFFLVRAAFLRSISRVRQHSDFFHRPDVIRDASSHRWSDAKCFVNSGEIVVQEMQGYHVPVILQLLAKSVR